MLFNLRRPSQLASRRSIQPSRYRPSLEPLENRLVPYALSGSSWAITNVSVSYMPDGTLISSSYPSTLVATYDAAYPTATWQYEFARALQTWASVTPLNFHFVADDGSPQGTSGLAQGDSRFGDIRLGGYNMGSGILGLGWSPGTTTTAGDLTLNTNSAYPIGSMPDLYSIFLHEIGHALGLNHSTVHPAVMEGGLWAVYPGLYADDIAGIQAIYGARQPDAYDATAANDNFASASPLTLSYGAVTVSADLTTVGDLDYYRVVVPAGSDGTLTVSVDARNLSLLISKVSIYDASGNLVATASAGSAYGSVATVSLTGLVTGQTYTLVADGGTTDVFGMGAYRLTAQFGGFTPPPPPPPIGPDRYEVNNTAAAATNFGTVNSVSQTGLTLHNSGDVDYYKFTAASKGTFTVSISPAAGSGTLSVAVLNAQQTVLATGQSQSGGVTLSVSLAAGKQYYIKVVSPTGSLFSYDSTIAKSAGGGGGRGGGGKHLVLAPDVFLLDGHTEESAFHDHHASTDLGQTKSGPQGRGLIGTLGLAHLGSTQSTAVGERLETTLVEYLPQRTLTSVAGDPGPVSGSDAPQPAARRSLRNVAQSYRFWREIAELSLDDPWGMP